MNEATHKVAACKRWRRELTVTAIKGLLHIRMEAPPGKRANFSALVYCVVPLQECSVMFEPEARNESALCAEGPQFYMSRYDGEQLVTKLGVKGWTR
jgi:hypothetical protein